MKSFCPPTTQPAVAGIATYWQRKTSELAGTVSVMVHVVGPDGNAVGPASAVLAPLPVVPFDDEHASTESERAAKTATVFFTPRSMT